MKPLVASLCRTITMDADLQAQLMGFFYLIGCCDCEA